MNTTGYRAIVRPYRVTQSRKLLIAAAITVASMAGLSAFSSVDFLMTLMGIVMLVSFCYLMVEGLSKTLGFMALRSQNHKQLRKNGLFNEAMRELETATVIQIDHRSFAVTDNYLCLPHGVILEKSKIAWIYPEERTVRYFGIPLKKFRNLMINLSDGTNVFASYGKIKDTQKLSDLISLLKESTSHLLFGNTEENYILYQLMTQKQ